MPTKPLGKWPHYAEWHRQDVLAKLARIERMAEEAQELVRAGHVLEVALVLGSIRAMALKGRDALKAAKNGERSDDSASAGE